MQRFADWFRDSEGRGYPGALVTVYESGTSNKPQLYNAGGSISSPAPISNPTFTDSNGYFAFAVPNGTYDIHLQGGGMPSTIIPNVTIGQDSSSVTADGVAFTPAGSIAALNVQDAIEELDAEKVTANTAIVAATKTKISYDTNGLVTSGTDATAADIVNVPAGGIAAVTVQAAINELDTEKVTANVAISGSTKTKITYDAKGLVTSGANATATDIVNTPAGSIAATTVQAAINELDSEAIHKSGAENITGIKTFISQPSGITAGSIVNVPSGSIASTNLQSAINELGSEKISLGDVVSQLYGAFTTTGTSTAYVLTPTPALAAYAANVRYQITPHTDSGASPTINISDLGAKSLKQYDSTGAKVAVTLLKSGQKVDVVYDGTDFVVMTPLPPSVSSGTGRLIGYQVFTASGTYSKGTNNPSFVIVEVVGGGGSGAASYGAAPRIATGGGSGGYSKKKISAASLAASETVTVGSGGNGSGGAGNNGSASSFGSFCSATGGGGGQYSTSSAAVPGATSGNGSGGDINSRGSGSSGAFTDVNGRVATSGGSSVLGGGGQGNCNTGSPAGGDGGIGAGGGAAAGANLGSSSGAGGNGIVIVWEYA